MSREMLDLAQHRQAELLREAARLRAARTASAARREVSGFGLARTIGGVAGRIRKGLASGIADAQLGPSTELGWRDFVPGH
ncbi:MAG TPA: hypothetical protein VNT28_00110 [Candidatus Limnocylindrales bacterium]|jgi:hypothetical protein|nr:hypothetical protein [Candidatus Limnocylindrales bacterium]